MANELGTKIFRQEARFIAGAAKPSQLPKMFLPQVAFVGKSNVGKSSLINTICRRKNLARVSHTPGRTRQINFFLIAEKLVIADLPGYGFAKVSQSSRRRWEQMIENYLRKRPNLNRVFVLIDSRHGPQKIDIAFIEQLYKWQIPCTIIFTKSDKEKPGVVARNVKAFFDTLKEILPYLPQGFVTSAEKRTGTEEVIACIEQYNQLYAEGIS